MLDPTQQQLRLTGCLVDLDQRRVVWPNGEKGLTAMEHKLLLFLVARAGQTVSRDDLLVQVWGYRPGLRTRAVDQAIGRLRSKIEVDAKAPAHLKSVYGHGYLFEMGPSPWLDRSDGRTPAALSDARRTNVTPDDDTFLGREEELVALAAALTPPGAWVTLVGPPGVGKTRISRQLLLGEVASSDQAGWFCELAAARTGSDVLGALAQLPPLEGLGDAAEPTLDRMAHALCDLEDGILVLDNVEQLTPGARDLVVELIERAPRLRWLLTSREPVGRDGERVVRLSPLSAEVGVRLYCQRARGVAPAVVRDPSQEHAIERLIGELGGLPLAIELAAALAALRPPEAMLARLVAGKPGLPARGAGKLRSLHGALDDSWVLLDDDARAVLMVCSLFATGFDLDAVEAVVGDGEQALCGLAALRQRSLVQPGPGWSGAGGGGHRLLPPVRAWARQRWPELEAEVEVWGLRYARWAAALGARLLAAVPAAGGPEARRQLARARPELQAGLLRCTGREPALAVRIALTLDSAWKVGSHTSARLEVLELARDDVRRLGDPKDLLVTIELRRGSVSRLRGELAEAEVALTAAEGLARQGGESALLGQVCVEWGVVAQRVGDSAQASARFTDAQALLEPLGPSSALAELYEVWGNHHQQAGELAEAEGCYGAALDAARRSDGDLRRRAHVQINLAAIDLARGRLAAARARYREALDLCRELGARHGEALALGGLGNAMADAGRLDEASALYDQALRLHRSHGVRWGELTTVINAAAVALLGGDLPTAELRYGRALVLGDELHNPRSRGFARWGLSGLAWARGELERAREHADGAIEDLAGSGDAWTAALVQVLRSGVRMEQGAAVEARAEWSRLRAAPPSDWTEATVRLLDAVEIVGVLVAAKGEEPAARTALVADCAARIRGLSARSEVQMVGLALRRLIRELDPEVDVGAPV